MGDKRGRPYDQFGGGRQGGGQHASKKHKPNDFQKRNGHGHGHGGHGKAPSANGLPGKGQFGKVDHVQEELSRLPDPKKCRPCKLAASEMQSGLIALLDHVVQDEATEQGDKDILKYARKLHEALSTRAANSSGNSTKELDNKRPEKEAHISIPSYTEHMLQRAKSLPPLPPIIEPHLQEAVFTHRSANQSQPGKPSSLPDIDYERLEFLGDAYIEVIASRLIYSRFPQLAPSEQSYFREQLVKNETLGHFSQAYGFADRLKHGAHMKESRQWTKILADVFEAYIAALIMSDPTHGYKVAEDWLTELWAPQLLDYKEKPVENPLAREELAKLVMGKGIKVEYREEKEMVHVNGVQKYSIGVYLTGWGFKEEWLGSGEGQNKAAACLAAAVDAVTSKREALVEANRRKLEVYPPRAKDESSREGAGKDDGAN